MSYGYGGPPGGHHPPPEHHAPPHLEQSGPGGYDSHESSNVASLTSSIKGITVKIFSEADPGFNLGVSGHDVVVLRANDSDPYQQWIKDESWSNKAKDSTGLPGFALINRGTGKALKHPAKEEEKVSLMDYYPNSLEEETLWTVSKDVGHGWHAIRSISDIHHNLDIDHGSKKYGPIKEGQSVIVFTWKDEANQHWKMENISEPTSTSHERRHHHGF